MPIHHPVLLEEVRSYFLSTPEKKLVIDATLGLGGHARMMLENMPKGSRFIGFDRDQDNLTLAEDFLSGAYSPCTDRAFTHSSFANIDEIVGDSEIDFILYDLGVSSAHYDEGDRGFSIRSDGPLDMRFDRTRGKTARDLVHTLSEKELTRIFFRYADEKKAPFIAQAICEYRKEKSLDTTEKLLTLIRASSFDPKSPIRVFQALRIAVNEEFDHIERSLESAIQRLSLGGRIAVITFHSLEDRLVKNIFAPHLENTINDVTGHIEIPARLAKLTKKPIEPTPEEVKENPRSRSAKLRIVERKW